MVHFVRTILLFLFIVHNLNGQIRNNRRSYEPYENWNDAEQCISTLAKKDHFSGALLVSNLVDKKVYLENIHGFANKKSKIENTIDTRFNIGSINKVFTAIGILQLVQSGKLRLSDKLVQYVPELTEEGVNKITLKHLLQMRSGYGSYFSSEKFLSNMKNLRNMEDYLPIIQEFELDFEPGTSRAYSNIGFELLGIVLQRVAKSNYYDYIQTNIYDKAGMENSGSFERDKPSENLAIGYSQYGPDDAFGTELRDSRKNNYQYNSNDRLAIKGTAAGGGYSTIEDLKKFLLAIKVYKLLDEKHTDLLINRYEQDKEKRKTFGFAGGAMGVSAHFWWDLQTNDFIIALSNYDPTNTSQVFGRLRKTLENL
ncbi:MULTISPECIES: serine hydrolase [Flavobacteriaceae]|uniref:serine hydrolase domain-containing protein n=1 Tax=Flavobacteriaceae TaxID=49546 RepID=UPI001491562E|nr:MULTISPECIES: serine hydrolase domain-containing protein [Allomuricauda]MDC6366690.1 serine hydrolase [Muricauda sp. AC10]